MGGFVAWLGLFAAVAIGPSGQDPAAVPAVRVPLNADGAVDLAAVVRELGRATATPVEAEPAAVDLPAAGRSRALTVQYLTDALRPDVRVEVSPDAVTFAIGPDPANAAGSPDWARRLRDLATRTRAEADRRGRYGFRARPSYRPNDPGRPTVCLVHGLNSTSGVFRHLIPPLEAAGYGVVTYDFPYNRDLDETAADYARDWHDFRRRRGEEARWVVVAHSMGGLLARWHAETARPEEPVEVAALLLIAPPNHGSELARGHALLQAVEALKVVRDGRRADSLATLGDGLGAAAEDMTPGSAFLGALNAHPRRAGVSYRIVAGDVGLLDAEARRRVEARLAAAGRFGGLAGLGGFLAGGLAGPLDEITDGRGDGCVAVASARLVGVDEFRILHADHLELIRAPLLHRDAGPVAALPLIREWLRAVAPTPAGPADR